MKPKSKKSGQRDPSILMDRNERRAYGWPEQIYFQKGYLACLKHFKLVDDKLARKLMRQYADLSD